MPLSTSSATSNNSSVPRAFTRGTRCNQCDSCRRPSCGKCFECKKKRCFGGDGSSKQACLERRCENPTPHASSRLARESSMGSVTSSQNNHHTPNNNNNNATASLSVVASSSSITTSTAIPSSAIKVSSSSLSTSEKPQSHHLHHPWGIHYKRPASLLGDRSLKRARLGAAQLQDEDEEDAILNDNLPDHVCGQDVPEPIRGICGICRQEGLEDAILLCDGEGCGKEFHLRCCVPPIMEVPEGAFYCIDCSQKGSTAQLEEYFAEFEQLRDKYELGNDDDDDDEDEDNASTDNNLANVMLQKDLEFEYNGSVQPIPGIPLTELDHSDPTVFLGKPVRLYCPHGNHYHNGRIVDVRPCLRENSDDDNDDNNGEEANDNAQEENEDTYCLVRFPAGKDHRKTPFMVWFRLEEHCVAVGMNIVWATFPSTSRKDRRSSGSKGGNYDHNKKWTRGMHWCRSARELVVATKEHTLKNQIFYRDQPAGNNKKPKKREWGFVEDLSKLGTGCYRLLKLEQCTRETIPLQQQQKVPRPVLALVQAELAEQARVQRWKQLPLENPYHSQAAITGRDEYTLGPLEYQTDSTRRRRRRTPQQIEPSPAIPQGLDRAYILKLLSNRLGVEASKDLASSLVCELVADPAP